MHSDEYLYNTSNIIDYEENIIETKENCLTITIFNEIPMDNNTNI